MTRRIRCDSKLRGLPEAQRVKVDVWLFEEGFTYEEVAGECLRQFGLQVSKSSVGRYYERVSSDRFEEKKRQERMALEPELSAARGEKHMATRVWVERRKAENWMARECLRHWRRTMRKKPHVSYLPMLVERKGPPLPGPLPHCVAEREKSASENYVAPVALGRRLIQANATEDLTLKRHECRDPAENRRK